MKIAVGSTNPVKLEAVELALRQLWPTQQYQIDGISAKSGVSEQPMSDLEMLKGAKNRALEALDYKHTQVGIGIEGGLHKHGNAWYGRSWVVAAGRNGQHGIGSSVSVLIPRDMMALVHQGKSMSEVCEILYGIKDIGKKAGYFGLLTNNAITRSTGYRDGVIMALATFDKAKDFDG